MESEHTKLQGVMRWGMGEGGGEDGTCITTHRHHGEPILGQLVGRDGPGNVHNEKICNQVLVLTRGVLKGGRGGVRTEHV